MMGATRRGEGDAGRGRQFLALCALVLALWIGHQFLMASERHAAVMDLTHGRAALASPVAALEGALAAHADGLGPERMPEQPMPLLGDCPAEQALVPVLLLLLLLGATIGSGWPWSLGAAMPGQFLATRPPPPPLLAARRRALLQIFRI